MIVKDTFDLIASLFSFLFIFFYFSFRDALNQTERLLGKLKTSFLRTGLVIRNSSLPSFCNLLPKSSRSRNFNMDRLFDKKKIVNL